MYLTTLSSGHSDATTESIADTDAVATLEQGAAVEVSY